MQFAILIYKVCCISVIDSAQLAGSIEYTYCISAEWWDPPPNECPGYDIKLLDGDAPALEIWGMLITPSLPGPLWPRVVTSDRVLYLAHIEQTVCKQMTDVKFWLLYSNTWNSLTVWQRFWAHLRMLSSKFVYKSYIYSKYMYKQDLALNNLLWLIWHKSQTNQTKLVIRVGWFGNLYFGIDLIPPTLIPWVFDSVFNVIFLLSKEAIHFLLE